MKKVTSVVLALTMLLLFALISSCENQTYPTENTNALISTRTSLYRTSADCSEPWTVTLVAGQNMDVGNIKIWNDETNLYVEYKITDDDWCITETHLHVADDPSLIPQTKNGNAIPGKFDYKGEHECISKFTYTIPLETEWECGELFIAAHAVVQKENVECIDFEAYTDEFTEISTQEAGINFFMADAAPLESNFNASIPTFELNIGDEISVTPTGDFPIIGIPQTYPPLDNIAGFTGPGGLGGDDFVNPAYTSLTGVGGNNLTDTQDRENYPTQPIEWHRHNQTQAIAFNIENQATEVSLYMLDPDGLEVFVAVALNENNEIVDFYTFTKDTEGITADGWGVLVELTADENLGLIKTVMAYAARKLIGQFDFVGYAIDNICVTTIEEETAWGEGPGFEGKDWSMYINYEICCEDPCDEWIVYGSNLNAGTAPLDDAIYAYDLYNMTQNLIYDPTPIDGSQNYPNANAYDSDNQRIYFGTDDGRLFYYEIGSGSHVQVEGGATTGSFGAMACGSWYNGMFYYVQNGTNRLYEVTIISDVATRSQIGTVPTSNGYGDIAFDPEYPGRFVASAGTVWYWYDINDNSSGILTWSGDGDTHHKQLAYGSNGILYGVVATTGIFYTISYSVNSGTVNTTFHWDSPYTFTDLASGPQCQ